MFEKFGEFESYTEINELAENLCNERDTDSLYVMARENGIEDEITQMYIEGDVPFLCDAQTAAMGKIDVEVKQLKPQDIMLDWVEYLRGQIMDDEKVALSVRKKGKTLEGMIGALLKWSFGHQRTIDKKILKAAGVNADRVTLGIPGMGEAKKIITQYYLEGEKQ